MDFMTAMTYDFHMFLQRVDNTTGYNSPLFTPKGESQHMSTVSVFCFLRNITVRFHNYIQLNWFPHCHFISSHLGVVGKKKSCHRK